jgi:hypothetical protein
VFTDYIDDVSTTYYDKNELAQNFGDASAQLSDPAITGNGGTGGAPVRLVVAKPVQVSNAATHAIWTTTCFS